MIDLHSVYVRQLSADEFECFRLFYRLTVDIYTRQIRQRKEIFQNIVADLSRKQL